MCVSIDRSRELACLFQPFNDTLRMGHQPGRRLARYLAIGDELCELAFRIESAGELGALLTDIRGGHLFGVLVDLLWCR